MNRAWRTVATVCLALVLMLSVIAVSCAPGGPTKDTFELKASQAMMPIESITHQDIIEMCDAITERTDGNITWETFGPEIGDWTELQRMTTAGTIDVQFNSVDTALDERWNITALPFLAPEFDKAKKVWAVGGIIDQLCGQWAEDLNWKYLGPWLNNVGSIGLNCDPVTSVAEANGVKLRVYPLDIAQCYVNKMGFTAVTIPWAEAPTAVATGVVEGWIGSGAVYWWDLFRDIARTAILTYELNEGWHVTMNLDTWNSLPAEYQTIVQEEATNIINKHLGQVEEEEYYYQQKVIDHGWVLVDMAKDHPQELAEWTDLARECWDEYDSIIGKEWMDQLRAAL